MFSALKDKIFNRAKVEAKGLLSVSAARTNRDKERTALHDETAALADLAAKRADLSMDDSLIQKHLDAENVIRVRITIAERKLATAETALEEAEAEAERAARAADYDLAASTKLAERFDEAFPKHAGALAELFRVILAHEERRSVVNDRLPPGASPLRPVLEFAAGDHATARLHMEVVDDRGAVLWAGDEFSSSENQLENR
jgi:hypothetical protein